MPELRIRELVHSAAPKYGKVPPHLRAHAEVTTSNKKKTRKSTRTTAGSRGSSKINKKENYTRKITNNLRAHAEVDLLQHAACRSETRIRVFGRDAGGDDVGYRCAPFV